MLDHAANAGLKRRVVVGATGRGADPALLERRVAEQLGPAGAAVVRESRREARR